MPPEDAAPPATDKPPLTADQCLTIVRDNLPDPGNWDDADGLDQLLGMLGVNGDFVRSYPEAIRARLQRLEPSWDIALADITCGPTVTVGDCMESVHDNAF